MREVAAKSMKLARDLDGMLDEALERDLLIRIGWGRGGDEKPKSCLLYTSPSPRDGLLSRMPSSA